MHIPKKYIVWVGILFLVVLGCIFISTQLYKPNVNFELAPDSATIKLDGSKKITAGGQKITPGKHTVSGSMNGFATKSISFTVTSSGVTTVIVVLDPNSAAGYDYLNKHPDQQRLRQKYGGLDYTAKATQLAQKNPIVRVLPYSSPDNTFRIDYGSDTPNASAKQTIFITASKQQAFDAATAWIQSKGYDPASLNIVTTIEPMIACLPYRTTNITLTSNYVNADSGQPKLTIDAKILVSNAERNDILPAIAAYKQQIADYITSCGGNPAAYAINYSGDALIEPDS